MKNLIKFDKLLDKLQAFIQILVEIVKRPAVETS